MKRGVDHQRGRQNVENEGREGDVRASENQDEKVKTGRKKPLRSGEEKAEIRPEPEIYGRHDKREKSSTRTKEQRRRDEKIKRCKGQTGATAQISQRDKVTGSAGDPGPTMNPWASKEGFGGATCDWRRAE